MGGSEDECNLIDLYAYEHFIAHKLLADENPTNEKLVYAWWMMAHIGRVEVSDKEYEDAKKACAEKMSEAKKGLESTFKGKTHSDATKKRMSEAKKCKPSNFKGQKHSDASKIKISEHHADVSGMNNPMYGKHHTDDTKKAMSQKSNNSGENNPMFGKKHSTETKVKMGKPVICVDTNQTYYSASYASECTGINRLAISKCCRGERKSAGGFVWKFVENQGESSTTIA